MINFLERKISIAKNQMTKKEKEISDWIIKNNPNFKNMSITKLSTKINVSPSAINRWCWKLGFDGYKDFYSIVTTKDKFDSKYNDLISTTSKDAMFSISTTESSLNYNDLILAINKISEVREVIFYGESFTFLQGEYFARMFQKININAKVINVASDLSIIMCNEKAVHIFISMSGRNQNILRAFEKLTDISRNQFFISICSNKKSNISDKVNAVLHGNFYQSIDIDVYELPITAKVTTEYILTQLFIHVYMKNPVKYSKQIKNIAKIKK